MNYKEIKQHPSLLVTPEIKKELLKRLSKKELIEEVEYLKRQNNALTLDLQSKSIRTRELELIIEKETDINLGTQKLYLKEFIEFTKKKEKETK